MLNESAESGGQTGTGTPPETATPSRYPGARMAMFYAALFAVIGVNMPFWPLWLASRGLDPSEIGVVVSLGLAMKVIANPLLGHFADRSGQRRSLMIFLSMGAALAYGSFWFGHSFWVLAVISMCYFALWSPLIPLGENVTMLLVREQGFDYGRIRLWGSVGFIVASVGAGLVLARQATEDVPDLIYMMVTGAIVLTSLTCIALPRTAPVRAESRRWTALAVLSDRRFVLFLVCSALIQASHSAYFAFATLHWKVLGHSELVIGVLWAVGVAAEIVLFVFAKKAVARIGALRLLMWGAAAGCIRWSLMPIDLPLAALFPLQVLHAFTFAAAHLGAMFFITDQIEQKFSATAQTLYSSAVMGVALSATTLVSGYLFELYGSAVFIAMAVMSLGGLMLSLVMIRTQNQ